MAVLALDANVSAGSQQNGDHLRVAVIHRFQERGLASVVVDGVHLGPGIEQQLTLLGAAVHRMTVQRRHTHVVFGVNIG